MSINLVNWENLEKRYSELTSLLNSPNMDNDKRHSYQKEVSYLGTILNKYREIKQLESEREELGLQENVDSEMQELFQEEINSLNEQIEAEKVELEDIMFPADDIDARSVFIEIRAGAGGQEASLFASDLLKMYTNYALKQNWSAGILSESLTDLGGYREVVLRVQGKNVYSHLKYESGVHRVQRVPSTETSGRIHTSTATVAVLPEAKEVDVNINPADLRIDVYRASGAGGQHVNTTDSAVRITHIPTGVVVSCQDERSQHKNKATALKMLQSRILDAEREKADSERSEQRKQQVGTGMRSEKVRTYNYPQNRVSDHQVGLTLKKLDVVMAGEIDEIIDALRQKEKEDRRKQLPVFLQNLQDQS